MTPEIVGVPGVTPVVQLGVGDRYDAAAVAGVWGGAGVANPAKWSTAGDANEWGGHEPLWHDITCDVVEVTTFTGRDGSLEVFQVGTATIVVRNVDGWADYTPAAVPDNVLTVRPGRQVRVGVQVGTAAPSWLWRGSIDVHEPGYDPVEADIVTFGCIDAKGDAGRAQMVQTLTPVGAGERAYERFWRILDAVGWPVWRRSYDVDGIRMVGTSYGRRGSDELDRTADSASGHVYGDTAGNIVIRNKSWLAWATGAPVDATIGNGAPGDVCPAGWEVRFARDDITTRAIVGRSGETPVVMDNGDGRAVYGLETWTKGDLLAEDNSEISRVGSRVLSIRSPVNMPRIAAVTLHGSSGPDAVAVMASASPFIPSRYRCRHVAQGDHWAFDRIMHVVGVTHTISPADGWTCRMSLDNAEPYRNVATPARWSDPNTRWSTDDQWATSF